jgi:hypothetical protein
MIASHADYADYRRIRLAPDFDERLAAAWYYVKNRSDGRYAARVGAYFDGAEPVFWAVHKSDEAGLEAYLQALPDGPHAEQALAELMRLRGVRRRDRARRFDSERSRARLEEAAARRREAAELALRWLRLLLQPSCWGHSFSDAPGALLAAYRLELPAPVCERDETAEVYRCTKVVERQFDVLVDGESVDRKIELWLELALDDHWRLQSARLLGDDLFVRHVEASRRRPVSDDDSAGRDRAVELFLRSAMEVIADSALDCSPADVASGLGARCGAVEVMVVAGAGGEDDAILLERVGQQAVVAGD